MSPRPFTFEGAYVDLGGELYVTDGTTAGTKLVKDIDTGSGNGYPIEYIPFNNKLYFSANDASHGDELWETDGTTAGTKLVKDFVAGSTGSYASPKAVWNNALWVYTSPTNGLGQMWKVDTSDTATMVKQLANNTSSAYSSGATSFAAPAGSKLFFSMRPMTLTALSRGSATGRRPARR